MEEQRSIIRSESCRRLLIAFFLLLLSIPLFSQTLTLEKVRQLRIVPEENQNLYTKTDIKFFVTIPLVRPSQVQVISAEQKSDISFRTMRKRELYDNEDSGTILEIWYSFDKKGDYKLEPLSVMIQNRKRSIAFEKISITDDPAKMLPRIVIIFDKGPTVYSDESENENLSDPLMNIPLGQKLSFTVYLQYATQLVKFNWNIPQNSIFTQTKEYEFTELKYRERVYSHDLIPVASFEWTGLKEGLEALPKFHVAASGYNGYRSELILPDLSINFTAASDNQIENTENDIFSQAFFSEKEEGDNLSSSIFTLEDCQRLAELYSKERNSFFTYFAAKRQRINFEESCGMISEESKISTSFPLYVSLLIILLCILGIIISKIRKHKIRLLIFITILFFALAVFAYSHIKRSEQFGICTGCTIYSIPENTAAASSEIGAGNTVRILENTGNWLYVELGQSGGWCKAEKILIIK